MTPSQHKPYTYPHGVATHAGFLPTALMGAVPTRSCPYREGAEGGADATSQDLFSQSWYIGHPSSPWGDDSPLLAVTV